MMLLLLLLLLMMMMMMMMIYFIADDSTLMYCENGGSVMDYSYCVCQDGFIGPHCEIREFMIKLKVIISISLN